MYRQSTDISVDGECEYLTPKPQLVLASLVQKEHWSTNRDGFRACQTASMPWRTCLGRTGLHSTVKTSGNLKSQGVATGQLVS